MNHYSEHILELYVRNSSEVESEKEAISQHLQTCAGCRDLVREMQEFYARTEDSKKLLAEQAEDSSSLMMEPHIGRRKISISYVPNSLPARFIRFVKKRPVTSSMFTVGFIVLGLYSINMIPKKNGSNPWYYEYNSSNNSVVVYDRNDIKLWEKRLKEDVAAIENVERTSNFHQTLAADIDHDGKNEVVILPALSIDGFTLPSLKIFDEKGILKDKSTFPFQKVQYKTKQYETEFIPMCVLFGGNKQKNLFVSFQNGRSPSVIVRYDENGNILGTYWHYGQLPNMMFFDANHDGIDELILNGINDTEDETARSYAVTVVLDPDRIIGNSESSATKGFGFVSSDAEEHYIRYPNPEIILRSTVNLFAKNELYKEGDKVFRVLTEAIVKEAEVAIEYYFDSLMAVTDAKFAGQTLIQHNQLYKEGKLKQPINEQYIKSLKESVLYWNGSQWLNKPVKHFEQLSIK
jgi:hypothetical protein